MRKSGVLLLFILVSTATYLLWIVTFEIESISSLFAARKRKLMIVKRYLAITLIVRESTAMFDLGLGLTIIRPVLERIQGFLLRVEIRTIFCIDIFLARDTMVLRMSVYS